MAVSTRSEKKFDISYAIRRFNENQDLLLEDIAKEFGMTRREMISRMKNMAGTDEKDRVRQVLRQDKRRQKRRNKVMQDTSTSRITIEVLEFEAEPEDGEGVANLDGTCSDVAKQRVELKSELESAQNQFDAILNSMDVLQSSSEFHDQIIAQIEKDISRQQRIVWSLESKLDAARANLDSLRTDLSLEQSKSEETTQKLQDVKQRVKEQQEYIDFLLAELKKLSKRVLNLIDPSYDLSHGLPKSGRFISTISMEGVEYEEIETDLTELTFAHLMSISQETGYSDFKEFGIAYKFSWLAIKYLVEPGYEVHVITDDERITKLINYLIK